MILVQFFISVFHIHHLTNFNKYYKQETHARKNLTCIIFITTGIIFNFQKQKFLKFIKKRLNRFTARQDSIDNKKFKDQYRHRRGHHNHHHYHSPFIFNQLHIFGCKYSQSNYNFLLKLLLSFLHFFSVCSNGFFTIRIEVNK